MPRRLFIFRVEKALEKKDATEEGIQTELHPLTEYVETDYAFSIWELKRRALQLSRTVKCATKSMQTADFLGLSAVYGIRKFVDSTSSQSSLFSSIRFGYSEPQFDKQGKQTAWTIGRFDRYGRFFSPSTSNRHLSKKL